MPIGGCVARTARQPFRPRTGGIEMYDLRDLIPLGTSAKISHTVKSSDAALEYSNGLEQLMATPAAIRLAIRASADAIDKYLPEGFISIGRFIEFEHTASTRVGMEVVLEATVVEVEPQFILLDVKACDELGEIGFGRHKRSIVAADYLLARSKRREAMTTNTRPI